MNETKANSYLSDSAQQELSNEYLHERGDDFHFCFCSFVHWTNVTTASKGFSVVLHTIFLVALLTNPTKHLLKRKLPI